VKQTITMPHPIPGVRVGSYFELHNGKERVVTRVVRIVSATSFEVEPLGWFRLAWYRLTNAWRWLRRRLP
jgi:hypothetical protein